MEIPLQPIEGFNRQFQLGQGEEAANWEQEMGKTMFHVVNSYIRATKFKGLSGEASYRLQKVDGVVLGMIFLLGNKFIIP